MIRKAEISDLPAIAGINSDGWRICYRGVVADDFLDTRTAESFIKRMRESKWLENPEIDTFVYEENGVVKGFSSGKTAFSGGNRTEGKHSEGVQYDCETAGLYVGVEYQGKGIGKKLFDFMKDKYRKAGCKTMIVRTIKGLPNNGFYLKMGGVIKETGEHEWGGKKYPLIGFVFGL